MKMEDVGLVMDESSVLILETEDQMEACSVRLGKNASIKIAGAGVQIRRTKFENIK